MHAAFLLHPGGTDDDRLFDPTNERRAGAQQVTVLNKHHLQLSVFVVL